MFWERSGKKIFFCHVLPGTTIYYYIRGRLMPILNPKFTGDAVMSFFNFTKLGRTLSLTAVLAVFAAGAWAQDTASVPFSVNVAATVKAVGDYGGSAMTRSIQVNAGAADTLRLPLLKTNGVLYFGAQRQAGVPAIIGNRGGKVTVNLPEQSYKNAEVLLYTVNGKRILRQKVSASKVAGNISRTNAATGIYLLSVKGTDDRALTSRITHSGGLLNINVVFGDGSESLSAAPQTAKKAADSGEWAVTVSAAEAGYKDSVYTLRPVAGANALQSITLRKEYSNNCGKDGTAGSCKTAEIGGKTWMAENLNYKPSSGNTWCVDGESYCDIYGRLYDWNTAKTVCPTGWHLPTRREWGDLAIAAGGTGTYGAGGTAGKALKSASGWKNNGNGTDDYGFSALPGGYINWSGSVYVAGYFGYWWTATESSSSDAYYRNMDYEYNYVGEDFIYKEHGHSVRCVHD
jgi:uncharacterized protein (TIGR02145 family)